LRFHFCRACVSCSPDVGHEPLQHVRTEACVQHAAQALMVRRVAEQHGAREQALEALELGAIESCLP
jgi:hypothetical protein